MGGTIAAEAMGIPPPASGMVGEVVGKVAGKVVDKLDKLTSGGNLVGKLGDTLNALADICEECNQAPNGPAQDKQGKEGSKQGEELINAFKDIFNKTVGKLKDLAKGPMEEAPKEDESAKKNASMGARKTM